MARVVVGVSGGIAAYKSCALVRLLREGGHDVLVIPTEASLQFVGAATWEALSGQPVATGVFEHIPEVLHVRAGQQADLVIVAPATADFLSRAAQGRANDLLAATFLTATCPKIVAPAMHTEMWLNPVTQRNVSQLRADGVQVIEPAVGRLTGADSGPGRLPEAVELAASVEAMLQDLPDLHGKKVLISAGGTREALDPVRYLGNRASGRQGIALAVTAVQAGASVTLVAANVDLPVPTGIEVVPVVSAAELAEQMWALQPEYDILVMSAAVADFKPAEQQEHKAKRDPSGTGQTLDLIQNPDILAQCVQRREAGKASAHQWIVGFAAETGDATSSLLDYGRAKLTRKGCEMLVVNEVGSDRGFEQEHNEVVILDRWGGEVAVPEGSKTAIAAAIWQRVAHLMT